MIEYDTGAFSLKNGVLFRWRGSVIPSALACAMPSAIFAVVLMYLYEELDTEANFRTGSGLDKVKASQLWSAMTGALFFLIGFRTNKAYSRFWDGTTLLHQMFGEWFDAASCLFAFSHLARNKKPKEVGVFRHTLVRLMSLCHASALDEIAMTADAPEGYPCIDVGGLDQTTLKWLKECKFDKRLGFNRVEVLIHLIQTLIVENQANGVLQIPPPILSRVFQTLSRGQVNLANCKKITATLFPFPYANLIAWLLIGACIGTPMTMSSLFALEHKHLAFFFTLVPIFGLVALNQIAGEIELPFGDDNNDLPLYFFQEHMNQAMLMLSHDQSNIVPSVAACHASNFWSLRENISIKRPREFIVEDREEKEPKDGAEAAALAKEGPPSAAAAPPAAAPPPTPAALAPAPAAAAPAGAPADLVALNRMLDAMLKSTGGLAQNLSVCSAKFQDLIDNVDALTSKLGACASVSGVLPAISEQSRATSREASERVTWH
eukprot:TRINITY_DN23828_c0_g1_i2.p1 TRINITY_DN23828_c0_g1~~TRINITY_DN23828_c0_g1_i2.p1  ORF type:complete len:491 (+),score=88.77 TRINITY_DN23828_c0_g1_i2:117-1589(+)